MKLSRNLKLVITSILLAGSYGITLHAIASELYKKGGYAEILSPQGEWVGMIILAIAIFVNIHWFWKLKIIKTLVRMVKK